MDRIFRQSIQQTHYDCQQHKPGRVAQRATGAVKHAGTINHPGARIRKGSAIIANGRLRAIHSIVWRACSDCRKGKQAQYWRYHSFRLLPEERYGQRAMSQVSPCSSSTSISDAASALAIVAECSALLLLSFALCAYAYGRGLFQLLSLDEPYGIVCGSHISLLGEQDSFGAVAPLAFLCSLADTVSDRLYSFRLAGIPAYRLSYMLYIVAQVFLLLSEKTRRWRDKNLGTKCIAFVGYQGVYCPYSRTSNSVVTSGGVSAPLGHHSITSILYHKPALQASLGGVL